MTSEALKNWAANERYERDWANRLRKDSQRLNNEQVRSLVQNALITIVGLSEDESELFMSNEISRPRKLNKEFKKTIKKVLDFLEEENQTNILPLKKRGEFFEGFAKAMEGFYTAEEVKQIQNLWKPWAPGDELSLTITLIGDYGFRHFHRETLREMLKTGKDNRS